jgi:hypothetical protein
MTTSNSKKMFKLSMAYYGVAVGLYFMTENSLFTSRNILELLTILECVALGIGLCVMGIVINLGNRDE